MVSEGPCNGEHAAYSVIKDEPAFGFYPLYFLYILAVVVDGQSFCNIALANYSPRIADIGNIEYVMCTFLPDYAHTSCRTTAVTI